MRQFFFFGFIRSGIRAGSIRDIGLQSELPISQVINLGIQPHKYKYVFGHINIIIVDALQKKNAV